MKDVLDREDISESTRKAIKELLIQSISGKNKVSFNLGAEDCNTLGEVSEKLDSTYTEAIRRALRVISIMTKLPSYDETLRSVEIFLRNEKGELERTVITI